MKPLHWTTEGRGALDEACAALKNQKLCCVLESLAEARARRDWTMSKHLVDVSPQHVVEAAMRSGNPQMRAWAENRKL